MRALLLALVMASTGLAGCLGLGVPWNDCPAPEVLLYHGGDALRHGDGVAPVLFWATNTGDGHALVNTWPAGEVTDSTMDPGADGVTGQAGTRAPVVDVVAPNQTSFGGFWLDLPAGSASVEVESLLAPPSDDELPADAVPVDCSDATVARAAAPVEASPAGAPIEVGKGVLVHTVGLWTNGTAFYTNDAAYHEGPYPKGYLGEYEGSDPLPVYVYDQTREEMPPRYERAGFFTTIEGFNAALKRMTVGVDALTFFPGEQGYTREGNEEHALYGDDLVFYIEAIEVVDVPCEVPEPVCDLPSVPPPLTRPSTLSVR